jgi:SsrA-binding protein
MKPDEVKERKERLILANKKARFEYEVIQTYEAGIELRGTEVKSLRQRKCSIQESYAAFPKADSHELYLINFHINPYEHGNIMNHEPKRQRKLLLHYREAMKLKSAIHEKGLTLIPLSIYFSGPYVKLKLGLARAKKKYDKREDKKKQDTEREIRRKFR